MTKEQSIYDALFAFQSEAAVVEKTADNPFYKSKYADLPAVWKTIHELLTKHHFLVINETGFKELSGYHFLRTIVRHVPTGQTLSTELPINPAKNDPQGFGAAITYHRRQNLVTLLGLVCAEEDDDGNAASGVSDPKPAKAPKPEPKPEPEPLSDIDMENLIEGVHACRDGEELEAFKKKLKQAKPRMNVLQLERASNAVKLKEKLLAPADYINA